MIHMNRVRGWFSALRKTHRKLARVRKQNVFILDERAGLIEELARNIKEKETLKRATRDAIAALLRSKARTKEESKALQFLQNAHVSVTGYSWAIGLPHPNLHWRGMAGSVEWSEEDSCWHGRVLNTRDLVSFEGANITELEGSFRSAVDSYLSVRRIA